MLTYICNSCGRATTKFEVVFVNLGKGLAAEEYGLCRKCAEALKKDLGDKNKED